ncbi:MAG TPA: class I SAM-dependent methyltransferase [Bacteroidia bacterium]|jgi:23S rRNA (cytosine1962-C5)-methyltransferase|nr:class I SAM-dependent methyltransferase [Bacteroidia bacterium]
MDFLSPVNFPDYELIDCGNFEKLERFGQYITIRPEPQAVWDSALSQGDWQKKAHVRFMPHSSYAGNWEKLKTMPDNWEVAYNLPNGPTIRFKLSLTSFKHVGIFPEQAVHWDYIYQNLSTFKGTEKPRFLNLFAYTGGASLAAKSAGADVIHLDSVRQVVSWAKNNMELSKLDNIRWLIEDAMKYVKREIKRGSKYQGIILDPPAYGHGPDKEQWKLEDNLNEMVNSVLQILAPEKHMLILNTYSLGFSSLIIENLLKKQYKNLQTGELFLPSASGFKLPLGVFGRVVSTL